MPRSTRADRSRRDRGLTRGPSPGRFYYTAPGRRLRLDHCKVEAGEILSATDFGRYSAMSVTGQGAQPNTALMAIPPRHDALYVPGSVYTAQTILVRDGRPPQVCPARWSARCPTTTAWRVLCHYRFANLCRPWSSYGAVRAPRGG